MHGDPTLEIDGSRIDNRLLIYFRGKKVLLEERTFKCLCLLAVGLKASRVLARNNRPHANGWVPGEQIAAGLTGKDLLMPTVILQAKNELTSRIGSDAPDIEMSATGGRRLVLPPSVDIQFNLSVLRDYPDYDMSKLARGLVKLLDTTGGEGHREGSHVQ